MTKEYKPLQKVLLSLSNLVELSGMSLREVQRKLEANHVNLNLYNVCSVANGKPEQLASIVKFDQYVNEILKITGHDEYDLLKEAIDGLSDKKSPMYQEDLSLEIKKFLREPDAKKYLEYAYKRYQFDKMTEEREKLGEELGVL